MADFGSDISCLPDLDPAFAPLTGKTLVLQACARRLMTPLDALWAHPDYGLDLRAWLNEGFTATAQAAMAAAIETELEKDERVHGASVKATYSAATSALRVDVSVRSSAGPFRLVLAVTRISVDLLYSE